MNNTRIKEILNEAGHIATLPMINIISKVWQETLCDARSCRNCTADGDECITCSRNFEDKFTVKEPEPEWYEDDSNFPLLCYVWDTESDDKDIIRIVTEFFDGYFVTSPHYHWIHATPLNKEKVLDFCLNP